MAKAKKETKKKSIKKDTKKSTFKTKIKKHSTTMRFNYFLFDELDERGKGIALEVGKYMYFLDVEQRLNKMRPQIYTKLRDETKVWGLKWVKMYPKQFADWMIFPLISFSGAIDISKFLKRYNTYALGLAPVVDKMPQLYTFAQKMDLPDEFIKKLNLRVIPMNQNERFMTINGPLSYAEGWRVGVKSSTVGESTLSREVEIPLLNQLYQAILFVLNMIVLEVSSFINEKLKSASIEEYLVTEKIKFFKSGLPIQMLRNGFDLFNESTLPVINREGNNVNYWDLILGKYILREQIGSFLGEEITVDVSYGKDPNDCTDDTKGVPVAPREIPAMNMNIVENSADQSGFIPDESVKKILEDAEKMMNMPPKENPDKKD